MVFPVGVVRPALARALATLRMVQGRRRGLEGALLAEREFVAWEIGAIRQARPAVARRGADLVRRAAEPFIDAVLRDDTAALRAAYAAWGTRYGCWIDGMGLPWAEDGPIPHLIRAAEAEADRAMGFSVFTTPAEVDETLPRLFDKVTAWKEAEAAQADLIRRLAAVAR